MTRLTCIYLTIALSGVVLTSGCRNQCNSYFPQNPFTSSSRISAPPTYSVRVPNLANQPYYGGANGGSIGAGLPLPNQGLGGSVPNGGWQNSNPGLSNPTSFSMPQGPITNMVPGFSVVGSTLPSQMNSQLVSQPYSSTQFDVRQDATRVPMTDATRVTAPTMLNPQQAYGGLAQAVYQGPAAQPYVARNLFPNVNNSNNELYGRVRSATPYAGYVAQAQPNQGNLPMNANLNLQNNSNIQNGWFPSQTASQPQPNRQ